MTQDVLDPARLRELAILLLDTPLTKPEARDVAHEAGQALHRVADYFKTAAPAPKPSTQLSLRDQFAMAALAGRAPEHAARDAYAIADRMMEQRKR